MRRVVGRFAILFWLKTVGISLFMTAFFAAYLDLLKHPVNAVTQMPLTFVDHWTPFTAQALPIYLSLWVYTSLPPVLMTTRGDLVRYGVAIGAVCLSGLACFYFWPTAVPPADVDWSAFPAFEFLKKIDSAGNACPSLHVASAVFSGLWLHRQLAELAAPAWTRPANLLWMLAIVYSTLATKQHVALDAFAGALLGGIGAWVSLRWMGGAKRQDNFKFS